MNHFKQFLKIIIFSSAALATLLKLCIGLLWMARYYPLGILILFFFCGILVMHTENSQ